MPTELDPRRLADFQRRLEACGRRRIPESVLWQSFAEAFPGRPGGAEEREWLLEALSELEERGVLQLPSPRGRRWDRGWRTPVPTSVDLRSASPREGREGRAKWRSFPWHPRLAWVADLPRLSDEQEFFLRRVHRALVDGSLAEAAPLRYRSLQLTGREKGLARLRKTRLFGPGRLDLELLNCLPEVLPLAWEGVGSASTMLLFENAGPFSVARRVLTSLEDPPYGMVAYGGGRALVQSIAHLRGIGRPVTSLHYVGDLDPTGLSIAVGARRAARETGLPTVEPAPGLHRAMVDAAAAFGHPRGWPVASARPGGEPCHLSEDLGFIPAAVRDSVRQILHAGNRIPEEVLGPEELQAVWGGAA